MFRVGSRALVGGASASDELATVTAERDKLQKDAAAAEANVSRLEADLSEARDAQTDTSELEAELQAARDRVTTLEAQVNAPTGDADAREMEDRSRNRVSTCRVPTGSFLDGS